MLDEELEFLFPCFNLGLAQRPSPRRFTERRFRFLQARFDIFSVNITSDVRDEDQKRLPRTGADEWADNLRWYEVSLLTELTSSSNRELGTSNKLFMVTEHYARQGQILRWDSPMGEALPCPLKDPWANSVKAFHGKRTMYAPGPWRNPPHYCRCLPALRRLFEGEIMAQKQSRSPLLPRTFQVEVEELPLLLERKHRVRRVFSQNSASPRIGLSYSRGQSKTSNMIETD